MNDITFTKVSNPFFTSPPKWLTWPLDVCGGVGYGWFFWFSRIFSKTSLELEMFSPTYNGERFFFCTERHERYLCQCRIFFFPGIYLHAFFLSKSVCMTFFCELTPITPSKVKLLEPKIHQTFGQLTDSDLSIIARGFWNNRRKLSWGEGRNSFLLTPTRNVRTDVRWRHNQIFSDG